MKRPNKKSKYKVRLGKRGYWAGYERGREQGITLGQASFSKPFEGTSIIIPSYNGLKQLRACIRSIEAHTSRPHEIIVVDQGSTDGSRTYLLRKSIAVRYALLPKGCHYTGCVNHGLMMAKGDTVVLLDQNTLVTPGWLDNMMDCLLSDPQTGVVGPVTNGPFQDQQIEVPYTEISEMWNFAATHNHTSILAPRYMDHLAGHSLLFRRDLLQKIGYVDEGFRTNHDGLEDWLLRVRLTGMRLAVADHAFIHYTELTPCGSDEQEEPAAVRSKNRSFFFRKWGDPDELLGKVERCRADAVPGGQDAVVLFYPEEVVLQSLSGELYRLERGRRIHCRHSKHAASGMAAPVRISQLDLLALPSEQLECSATESTTSGSNTAMMCVFAAEEVPVDPMDGDHAERTRMIERLYKEGHRLYQIGEGWKRPFATSYAALSWGADYGLIRPLSAEKLAALVEGLPIIAPPVLDAQL